MAKLRKRSEERSKFKARTRERSFILSVIMATAKMMLLITLLLMVGVGGLLVGVAKAWVETAPALDVSAFDKQAQTSFIYDKNGYQITDFRGIENRVDATYDELPRNLISAVTAVEDMRFFTHNGVDVRRIVGAVFTNLVSNTSQGGSTITQQVVKLTMLSDEQTFKRKLQEAYLAIQLEGVVSKEQIIEEYMNIMYLGGSNYGVKVAALDYFGKELNELSLRECAAIARMIRDPSYYNPRKNYYERNTPEIIEDQTDYVLGLMYEQDLITKAEYDSAMSQTLSVRRTSTTNDMENKYYVEYAIYDVVTKMLRYYELNDTKANRSDMESQLRTGGYKIYTSLDPEIQEAVQKVITDWDKYPKTRQSADAVYEAPLGGGEYLSLVQPQAAATVLDWRTGEIIAIVGGRSEPTALKQTSRAYMINMPVGSAIKPLSVYGPAFDMGQSPASPVINAPIKIKGWDSEKGYPDNYSGDSFTGVCSMRTAINKSYNTATAQALFTYVGIENSVAYLKNMGVADKSINADGFGLACGSSGLTTVEMAGGFGAIANRGVYLEPLAFSEVQYADGTTFINAQDIQIKRQVFKESTAWMLVDVLKGCVTSGLGTGSKANFGGFTVGGKTGTNTDSRGVSFTGMTAYYVASVWIGHEDYKALVSSATGGDYAAPLWAAIMSKVHDLKGITINRDIVDKSAAEVGLVMVEVCGVSGMLPTAACVNDINGYKTNRDWYLNGTQPTKTCNMHGTVRVCSKTKQIPSRYCTTVAVGGLYLPEGHPLRNDSAEIVRQYFKGATTNKGSASLGTCTSCGGGGGNTNPPTRDEILGYADKALSEAVKVMGSSKVNPADYQAVENGYNALKEAVDNSASTDEIRDLTSELKKINEAIIAKIT